jgi:hypothetical protein
MASNGLFLAMHRAGQPHLQRTFEPQQILETPGEISHGSRVVFRPLEAISRKNIW